MPGKGEAGKLPEGGGAFLVAWQLSNKRVLVVGGGDVASGRIKSVLDADALVTVIAPQEGLHPLTRFYIDHSDRITYHNRMFSGPEDLDGVYMVLSAIDDVEESSRICMLCRECNVPVNVADIPNMCDFYFGSQIRRGPLQILISTNGNGPKLASIIKTKVDAALPSSVGPAIKNVGVLRARLREKVPGTGGEMSRRRMRWMSKVCTDWTLDELAGMDDEDMEKLLSAGWDNNSVLRPKKSLAHPHNETRTNRYQAVAVGFMVGFVTACILTTSLHRSKWRL